MSGLMKVSSNPHIRDKASTDKIMGAVIVALLPTTIIGTFAFVCGISGYFFGRMNNIFFRILMILGGCLLIDPGIATDLIGVACIAVTAVYRFLIKKGPDQPRAIA